MSENLYSTECWLGVLDTEFLVWRYGKSAVDYGDSTFLGPRSYEKIGYDLSIFLLLRQAWLASRSESRNEVNQMINREWHAMSHDDVIMVSGMSFSAPWARWQTVASARRDLKMLPPYAAEDQFVTQRRLLCWLAYCMARDYELSTVPRGLMLSVYEADALTVLSLRMRQYSVDQLLGRAHVEDDDYEFEILIKVIRTNILAPCDALKISKEAAIIMLRNYPCSNNYGLESHRRSLLPDYVRQGLRPLAFKISVDWKQILPRFRDASLFSLSRTSVTKKDQQRHRVFHKDLGKKILHVRDVFFLHLSRPYSCPDIEYAQFIETEFALTLMGMSPAEAKAEIESLPFISTTKLDMARLELASMWSPWRLQQLGLSLLQRLGTSQAGQSKKLRAGWRRLRSLFAAAPGPSESDSRKRQGWTDEREGSRDPVLVGMSWDSEDDDTDSEKPEHDIRKSYVSEKHKGL